MSFRLGDLVHVFGFEEDGVIAGVGKTHGFWIVYWREPPFDTLRHSFYEWNAGEFYESFISHVGG